MAIGGGCVGSADVAAAPAVATVTAAGRISPASASDGAAGSLAGAATGGDPFEGGEATASSGIKERPSAPLAGAGGERAEEVCDKERYCSVRLRRISRCDCSSWITAKSEGLDVWLGRLLAADWVGKEVVAERGKAAATACGSGFEPNDS